MCNPCSRQTRILDDISLTGPQRVCDRCLNEKRDADQAKVRAERARVRQAKEQDRAQRRDQLDVIEHRLGDLEEAHFGTQVVSAWDGATVIQRTDDGMPRHRSHSWSPSSTSWIIAKDMSPMQVGSNPDLTLAGSNPDTKISGSTPGTKPAGSTPGTKISGSTPRSTPSTKTAGSTPGTKTAGSNSDTKSAQYATYLHQLNQRRIEAFGSRHVSTDDEDVLSPRLLSVETDESTLDQECSICLDLMIPGDAALFTTGCHHTFHWTCIFAFQKSSESANTSECPTCRRFMPDMAKMCSLDNGCTHPRARVGHRFCRECGQPVSQADWKPSPNIEDPDPVNPPHYPVNQNPGPLLRSNSGGYYPPTQSTSSTSSLVRCPQCHIQLRVLPHMYNMRVACPSGHQFQVSMAQNSHDFLSRTRPSMNRGYPGSRWREQYSSR